MGISALLASQILDASATGRSVITGADASAIRSTLGLGTLATQSPTGTPSASTFLRGDYSWQTIDLSGYVPYSGATGAVNLGSNSLTAGPAKFEGVGTTVLDVGRSGAASNERLLEVVSNTTWANAGFVSILDSLHFERFEGSCWISSLANSLYRQWEVTAGSFFKFSQGTSLEWYGADFRADTNTSDLVIRRDAANTLAQRNSTNAQRLNLYGTYTDASNYRRLFLSSTTAGAFTLGVEGAGTGASGNTLTVASEIRSSVSLSTYNPAASMYGQIRLFGNNVANGRSGISFEQSNSFAIEKFFGVHQTLTTGAFVWQGYDRPSSAWHEYMRLAEEGNLTLTPRWNNAATTFTGILANVTNTASNANSLLMDLQTSGTSRFSVAPNGTVSSVVSRFTNAHFAPSGFFNSALVLGASGNLQWKDNNIAEIGTADIFLVRDAAQTLAQRNAGNAQRFNLYGTFTNSSNYERMFLEYNTTGTAYRIGTENAGTGSARAMEFQTGGTTRLTLNAGISTTLLLRSAGLECSRAFIAADNDYFYWATRSVMSSPSNGVILFTNLAVTDFSRLQLGGTTSSFPAIKRNAAALNFRLADDSADCDITAAALTLSGNLTISTKNLVTDTTTGTKIGTATNQKIGFYNATPVVQPTAVADATDAASVITQLNALLSRMRDLGLIAT